MKIGRTVTYFFMVLAGGVMTSPYTGVMFMILLLIGVFEGSGFLLYSLAAYYILGSAFVFSVLTTYGYMVCCFDTCSLRKHMGHNRQQHCHDIFAAFLWPLFLRLIHRNLIINFGFGWPDIVQKARLFCWYGSITPR